MPFFKITDTGGAVGPDLTGIDSISTPEYIQFDTTTVASPTAGRLGWDTTDDSLTLGLTGSGDYVRLGEDLVGFCINNDTVQINKGQVVYVSGAQGDKIAIKLANNTQDLTSARTFGIAMQDIAVNSEGYVMHSGRVSGLSLGAYTTGDILWLGDTAGSMTVTKPYAPNHLVFVGVVLRANAGNGILYVNPQNGYELGELHNVLTNGATDGQVLYYDGPTSLWTHKTPTFSDVELLKFHQNNNTIDIPDRAIVNTSTGGLGSGNIYLHHFTAPRNMTVSSITMATGSTLASGLTLARMGLYTASDTAATLVARTASDTTLFTSTSTAYTRSFSTAGGYPATYNLVAGERYAIAVICTGTTMPSLVSAASAVVVNSLSPRIASIRTSQTDLLASITTFATTTANVWGRLS